MQHAKVLWVHEAMFVVVRTVVSGASRLVAQRPVAVRAVRVREVDVRGALRPSAQRKLARALIVDDDGRAVATGDCSADGDTELGRVCGELTARFPRGSAAAPATWSAKAYRFQRLCLELRSLLEAVD